MMPGNRRRDEKTVVGPMCCDAGLREETISLRLRMVFVEKCLEQQADLRPEGLI